MFSRQNNLFNQIKEETFNVKNFNPMDYLNSDKPIITAISIFIALFISFGINKLPKPFVNFLDNFYFKILFIILISFIGSLYPLVTLILCLAMIISIQTLNSYKAVDKLLISVENLKDNQNNVPLSPGRSQLIQDSIEKAKIHKVFADKASMEGNHDLANEHLNEINKQDIKIDSIVKAKKCYMAAKEAESQGNAELAAYHLNEEEKHKTKYMLLTNAETLKTQGINAVKAGDTAKAQELYSGAKLDEYRVTLLLNEEKHLEALDKAKLVGDVEKIKLHTEEINKIRENLYKVFNDNEYPSGDDFNSNYSSVDNVTLNVVPVIPEEKKIVKSISNEVVNGYDALDYATY
jgi:hypothetical protein